MRLLACIWSVILTCVACGGGGDAPSPTPTTPTPVGPTAPPASLTATPEMRSAAGNEYRLQWSATADGRAQSYVVEMGSSSGAADLPAVETGGTATTHTLVSNARGPIFIRVRARSASGLSAPSNEVQLEDIRDMVEGLFFATGRLQSPSHQPICQFTSSHRDLVHGFARGTPVTATISNTTPAAQQTAASALFEALGSATNGALSISTTTSSDRAAMEDAFTRNRFQGTNTIVFLDVDNAVTLCGALGCGGGRLVSGSSLPVFQNGFAVVQRADAVNSMPAVAAHELGHAVGLCHVTTPIMGERTLMGTSAVSGVTALSAAERAAVRSLYRSGLGPGASRQQLVAAGLL